VVRTNFHLDSLDLVESRDAMFVFVFMLCPLSSRAREFDRSAVTCSRVPYEEYLDTRGIVARSVEVDLI